jgi:hypothetical protein
MEQFGLLFKSRVVAAEFLELYAMLGEHFILAPATLFLLLLGAARVLIVFVHRYHACGLRMEGMARIRASSAWELRSSGRGWGMSTRWRRMKASHS